MEHEIKIAADSIEALRASDVFRVLEWSDNVAALADYITSNRPDLSEEVSDCLEDLAA